VNGLEALRYLLPHVPFPAEIDNFIHRRIALSLHALRGAMALFSLASGKATGIPTACWDGSTAALSCWGAALPCG